MVFPKRPSFYIVTANDECSS